MKIYLSWSESFLVGVPELDADHRALVQLINEACDACARGEGGKLRQKIDALRSLAAAHFAREEGVLDSLPEYRNPAAHANEHRNRLRQLDRVASAVRSSEGSIDLVSLQSDLIDWFVQQAVGHDAKIKAYFDNSRREPALRRREA